VRLKLIAGLALSVMVAACAQTPKPVTPTPLPPVIPKPAPVTEPSSSLKPLTSLPGWGLSDSFVAFEALRGTCAYKKGRQYQRVCENLSHTDFADPDDIKAFFEANFGVEGLDGEGLLTAYFVPEYEAVSSPDAEFSQPVRLKPADLVIVRGDQMFPPQTATKVAARMVDGQYVPYYTRAEIEAQPAQTPLYMRPEDYFFMQLQGSGYLELPDGSKFLAAYAADNGHPFVGIAKPMVDRGILEKDKSSGDNIRAWLAANRGDVAREMMNLNPRYAFFKIEDPHDPLGAAGVPLPGGSAIAVDPAHHQYGDLYWIDANAGALKDAFPQYQRMVSALDTGGAIKGKIRADLYMGHGARAGTEAGRVKHKLKMWRIVPKY
jgi:membrane-bound lytic murein transglycosylase A